MPHSRHCFRGRPNERLSHCPFGTNVGRGQGVSQDTARSNRRTSLKAGSRKDRKGSTVKENLKHMAEAIVDALLKSDQMESTARYLRSGRRFANLETEEIKRRWTEATRNFLISYGAVNPREMDDLGSETGLRKAALPWKNVSNETAAVARRIEHDDDPEGCAGIRDQVRNFLDDLEATKLTAFGRWLSFPVLLAHSIHRRAGNGRIIFQ